jgi:hypothetical protein
MRRWKLAWLVFLVWGLPAAAQVPQPFPRPQNPGSQPPPSAPAPKPPAPQPSAPPTAAVPSPAPAPATTPGAPTEAMLGFPIYPNAQFLVSYDAGRGQRYYLFGTESGFAAIVGYYQGALKTKGTLVFDAPATHIFEFRFREETMAYPPGVTVKDYTWKGSAGYLNPRRGAQPERFPTIIQIVPAPAGQKP